MVTKMKIERVKRGLSQIKLAKIAEAAAGDVSRIELGRMIPYPGQARRLAKVLALNEQELQQPVEIRTSESCAAS